MPNVASALKSEIARIARKEVKAEVSQLRKSAVSHRKEIADLKRRAHSLEQTLKDLGGRGERPHSPSEDQSDGLKRFSANGLLAHRNRLGLSAGGVALLLGTSAQTIYNWEQGKARPRAIHLPAIAALRTLGKKDAAAIVASRAHGPGVADDLR